MQQWYKPDVSQRFYIYHALNSALQLEDLKTKAIPIEFADKNGEKQIKEIKDYRVVEPVLTLIWMVADSLNYSDDYVSFKLMPEAISDFIKKDGIWRDDNFAAIMKERGELVKMLNNDTKNVDFLQKNKLVFIFQKNIVQNFKQVKDGESPTKYSRWFDFALKTLNENNSEEDFKEYKNSPLFKKIIDRLDQSKLSDDDKEYILNNDDLLERYARFERGILEQGLKEGRKNGIKEGVKKGLKEGMEKGMEKEKIEVATNLIGLLEFDVIAEKVGLPLEKVRELAKNNPKEA